MEIYTIEEKDYSNKKVFMRVDFNVPIKDGEITDDTRIKATIPTIEKLLSQNASLILASHLGRPKGKVVPEMSLKPVAKRLSELLNKEVKFVEDCVGEKVKKMASELKPGEILLLENLRFHKEEEEGDENFAKELASLADCYVNDAFATCHRKHASIVGIPKFIKDVAAGLLIKKEIEALSKLLTNPERPFLLILGGAKVLDKIGIIKNLLDKVDTIITGGVMGYTFIKAKNWEVGDSKVEEEAIPAAKEIIKEINKRHLEFHTPLDHIIADKISEDAHYFPTERGTVPPGWKGVDIGPQAIEEYVDCIKRAKTIFWNGPLGIFEIEPFAKGTIEIAKAIANSDAFSVVGGGDSIAAVNKAGVADKISHICTGGGASLEFLQKGSLPGIEILKK
ncbi:MAG: phosphoglycerate kinase [Candidatus Omnitrophota bacterium]|nr:MAG: phosphoglycerate kinase [Candidatus Omnitrophota bacterium]